MSGISQILQGFATGMLFCRGRYSFFFFIDVGVIFDRCTFQVNIVVNKGCGSEIMAEYGPGVYAWIGLVCAKYSVVEGGILSRSLKDS